MSGVSSAARGIAPAKALEAVLVDVLQFARPADVLVSDYFRRHRNLGRRDRAVIAQQVFAVLRNRRLYAHLAESGPGSNARRLALIADADRGQSMLAPDPHEASWLAHVARVDRTALAPAVRYSLPDWLYEAVQGAGIPLGFDALAQSLLMPAALDLRANLLKTDVRELAASLLRQGIASAAPDALPGNRVETALRLAGHPALERLDAFASGHFEVQDAGSQWVVAQVAPRRGQTVVDFCAGAGGKTLAMAALMRNTGQIYACDTSLRRLARLRPRLARSGATNVQPLFIESETDARLERLRGLADLVLVDAPCSGTGTLRRNPDLKWRQSPESVARLAALQTRILVAASTLVKPGGRLAYVTCSLLRAENEAVARAFEAQAVSQQHGFERLRLAAALTGAADPTAKAGTGSSTGIPDALGDTDRTQRPETGQPPSGNGAEFRTGPDDDAGTGFSRLWPHLHGTDGFFLAAWARSR